MLDTINDLPYTVIVLSRNICKLMLLIADTAESQKKYCNSFVSSYQRVSNLEYSHIHYDTQENP
jgi:hypothetical protein